MLCVIIREALPEIERVSLVVACRLLGGYLTTSTWIHQANRTDGQPECMFYAGIVKKRLSVHFTEVAWKANRTIVQALRALGDHSESSVTLVDSMRRLRQLCEKYRKVRGARSKPWGSLCCLAANTEDKRATVVGLTPWQRRLVRTPEEFLDEYCCVVRAVAWPGGKI